MTIVVKMIVFFCSCLHASAAFAVGWLPPSEHWVFKQSSAIQATTVSLSLQLADSKGQALPWWSDTVYDCQPWDVSHHLMVDSNKTLQGPIGDWSFHTCMSAGTYAVLFSTQLNCVLKSTPVKLRAPANPVSIGIVNESGVDWLKRLWLRAQKYDEETKLGIIPMLHPGVAECMNTYINKAYNPGLLRKEPGEDCIVTLMSPPHMSDPGFALFTRHRADVTTTTINESQLATLAVSIPDWYGAHLILNAMSQEERPCGMDVPLQGAGTFEIKVVPGVYQLTLNYWANNQQVAVSYVTLTRTLEPGGRTALTFTQAHSISPEVMDWNRSHMLVWFDLRDSQGHDLQQFDANVHLILKQDGATIVDKDLVDFNGRAFETNRDWGENYLEKPVDYEYRYDSPATGVIVKKGLISPKVTISDHLVSAYQTTNFEVFGREKTENGKRVAQSLEAARTWLAANLAGPVHPSSADRYRIEFSSIGWGWSDGDHIWVDLYSPQAFWPETGIYYTEVLMHEFGHSYTFFQGAQWEPSAWGRDEWFASWVGQHCIRALYGERAFKYIDRDANNSFFETPPDEALGFAFVLHYIDNRFGGTINRDVYRAIYTGWNGLCAKINQMSFLKTNDERYAVLHSHLTRMNLGWLYRMAHLSVSDVVVRRGMTELGSASHDWGRYE